MGLARRETVGKSREKAEEGTLVWTAVRRLIVVIRAEEGTAAAAAGVEEEVVAVVVIKERTPMVEGAFCEG